MRSVLSHIAVSSAIFLHGMFSDLNPAICSSSTKIFGLPGLSDVLRHIKCYDNVQKYYQAVTKDSVSKTGGNSLINATGLQVLPIKDTSHQC